MNGAILKRACDLGAESLKSSMSKGARTQKSQELCKYDSGGWSGTKLEMRLSVKKRVYNGFCVGTLDLSLP